MLDVVLDLEDLLLDGAYLLVHSLGVELRDLSDGLLNQLEYVLAHDFPLE